MKISGRFAVTACGLSLLAALPVEAALRQDPVPWVAPARKAREISPMGPSRANVQRGKELFTVNCVVCHGEQAHGDGPAAVALLPRPRDLTAAEAQSDSDGSLFWKLSEGRAPMPGFKVALPDADRWLLIHYLRSLELRARWKQPFDRAAASYELLRAELPAAEPARLADYADGLAAWIAEVPLPESLRKDAPGTQAWNSAVAGLQKSCAGFAGLQDPAARADAFNQLSRQLLAWTQAQNLAGELPLRAFEQDGLKDHGPWLWLQSAEAPASPYPAPPEGAKPRAGVVLAVKKAPAAAN